MNSDESERREVRRLINPDGSELEVPVIVVDGVEYVAVDGLTAATIRKAVTAEAVAEMATEMAAAVASYPYTAEDIEQLGYWLADLVVEMTDAGAAPTVEQVRILADRLLGNVPLAEFLGTQAVETVLAYRGGDCGVVVGGPLHAAVRGVRQQLDVLHNAENDQPARR